jgi:hypothetical protein
MYDVPLSGQLTHKVYQMALRTEKQYAFFTTMAGPLLMQETLDHYAWV